MTMFMICVNFQLYFLPFVCKEKYFPLFLFLVFELFIGIDIKMDVKICYFDKLS